MGPLLDLEKKILEATPAIERWFRLEWQEHTPPFYCSVDLRNAGFKLAPVDTNLFPAVSIIWHRKCCRWQYRLQWPRLKILPGCPQFAGDSESQPRNAFYLQNIARMMQIFRQTGLNVRLGSLSPEIKVPTPVLLPDGQNYCWNRWNVPPTDAVWY
jgi:glutamate--cysteine ligase